MTPAELRGRNFITVKQAAEILGVDERTTRRGIEQGQIPAVKVGTKTLIPAPRFAALIDPIEAPAVGVPLVAVGAAGPDAIAVATEILRGALRAIEALGGYQGQNHGAPGEVPAAGHEASSGGHGILPRLAREGDAGAAGAGVGSAVAR